MHTPFAHALSHVNGEEALVGCAGLEVLKSTVRVGEDSRRVNLAEVRSQLAVVAVTYNKTLQQRNNEVWREH